MTKKPQNLLFVSGVNASTAFFLQAGFDSGNSMSLKGRTMSAFGKGTLATVLAAAMTVTPSLAQESSIAAKPTTTGASVTQRSDKPNLIDQVGDYSESYPGVVIGISKGQKEKLLTGEQIGDKLSEVLKKGYGDIPSKYFVAPGGDYTAVIFAVKGHIYGPYGLKESLSGIALPADNYNSKVHRGIFLKPDQAPRTAAPGVAAKPEPQQ